MRIPREDVPRGVTPLMRVVDEAPQPRPEPGETSAACPDPEDAGILAACRAREPGALDRLMARHAAAVYRTLNLMLRDGAEAQDLTQETFLRFFTTLQTFRAETSLRSWMLRIATNLALNRVRDRKRGGAHRVLVSTDSLPEDDRALSDLAPGPESIVMRRMEVQEVEAFLEKLTPPLRAVAVLRFYQERSYEEIAAILDIHVGTVRSRLNAVRWQARALFGRE